MKRRATKSSGNIFLDLGFPPDQAANLLLRSTLMIEIERLIEKRKLTQAKAAKLFGVTQPRINDLLRGRISRFSLDALVNIAAALGRRVHIELEAA